MPGIIVLDGADATGKSTLQQMLVDKYKAIPIHLTYNNDVGPRMFDYQTEEMVKAIHLSNENLVVVDRHWISEAIYARVFRGGSPWPHMGRMMDRVWMKHAAMYVLCLPSDIDEAVERHHRNLDPTHPYADLQFVELLERYNALYEGNFAIDGNDYAAQLSRTRPMCDRPDVVPYRIDCEGHNMTHFCECLMFQLGYWRKLQWPKALDPDYKNFSGHLAHSDYLIVGDAYNAKPTTIPGAEWPFYEYKNSSLYLNTLLAEIGLDETRVIFTNSINKDGSNNYDIKTIADEGFKVITLGGVAASWCKHLGVKVHAKLFHPQYIKRFSPSYTSRERYIEDWKGALSGE